MLTPRLCPLPAFEHEALDAAGPARSRTGPERSRSPEAEFGSLVTLRPLRTSDAAFLFQALTPREVTRFISAPPATVAGFEKFIAWTERERAAGAQACFAVVPRGADVAIGIFQVRALDASFETAEWGFAIAPEFWGSGVFLDAALLVVGFAFQTLGVRRLEARAAVANGRGNGALSKVGAIREAILRRSFARPADRLDQALWTILADDWRRTSRPVSLADIH
jgi:[ribosomal protein S5]-alanine N-acetyltransferase